MQSFSSNCCCVNEYRVLVLSIFVAGAYRWAYHALAATSCTSRLTISEIPVRLRTPTVATGGEMLGCTGGRWVLGAVYKQPTSMGRLHRHYRTQCTRAILELRRFPSISLTPRQLLDLPQVPGMYEPKIYEEITPARKALNETVVSTAAECAALVQRDHITATAAEYSNTGHGWCNAVFEAVGVIRPGGPKLHVQMI